MSKTAYILLVLVSLQAGLPFFALGGQSNETISISTYYPSPYGVYRTLEVKRGLAVGDIKSSSVGNMNNLQPGQLYINESVILNTLTATPATGKPGQLIYVGGTEHVLKYHNDTTWVDLACSPSEMAPVCGASASQSFASAPTSNLCSIGTASTVSGSGPWTWTCTNAAAKITCTANKCSSIINHYKATTCSTDQCRSNWGSCVFTCCVPLPSYATCTTPAAWGTIAPTCTYYEPCKNAGCGSCCSGIGTVKTCTGEIDGQSCL
jgi:hypothetical protein